MDPFNSKFILKEKRWLWIDYDKGISIILVGYGHCMEALYGHVTDLNSYPGWNYFGAFFYGFRMPLFFIISGLLVGRSLNKKGLNNYIGDRTNNILFPLLIWGILETTLQIIAARFTGFTNNTSNAGLTRYINLIIDPRQTGHFWYLNALFCIGVIYASIKSIFKLKPVLHVLLGFALYAVSAYIHVHDINAFLLTDIFEYYFFFALGDLISNIMLDEKNIQRFSSWKIFVPLLVIFLIVQYHFTDLNIKYQSYNRYVELKMPLFFLLEALIGCTTSVSFSFLLQKYKVFTWIRIVGYHSLFIYCMQIVAMTFARIFFQNFLHITYTPALIMLVWTSGIALPIFFYNFCLRYNLWWLYTFRKPEKQVDYLRHTNIFSFKKQKIADS
jgi:fucose 4-O-acetylase-like acetyltransferase